ncbi:MAG: hypothetical protein WC969_09830 [Elusimicrobiota bacterium]|jgi:hypothetical protein
MTTKLLAGLALLAVTSFAAAQEKPAAPAPTRGKFTNCMWPNPCGATGSAPILPPKKDEVKAPQAVPNLPQPLKGRTELGDPLNQKIVEGRIVDEENGGVVSALRGKDGSIVYQGEPLRDAVGSTLALPTSTIPAKANDAVSAPADKDWNSVALKTVSAGQVNGMRAEQKAVSKGSSESRTGAADRMWGSGRK